MRRLALLAVLTGALALAGALGAAIEPAPAGASSDALRQQLAAERHAHRALAERLRREVRRARAGAARVAAAAGLAYRVSQALTLASLVYGVPRAELEAVARCESGLRPFARNPSGASGLLQFMPGTYAGTPFGKAGLDIFSPEANALAAGWLASRAGWRPWTCKPT